MNNVSQYFVAAVGEAEQDIDGKAENLLEKSWVILCDFDGTISLRDVTDALLGKFGMVGYEELEDEWKAGKIGSRDCMEGQIALLDMSKAELDSVLDAIAIDSHFKAFLARAKDLAIPVVIVSDGLDYAIQRILQNNQIEGIPVFANELLQRGERRWQLEFPNAFAGCTKGSGNCKCARSAIYQQANNSILFVGDGSSDYCVSGKVDYVLAKSSLIGYCQQQAFPHLSISGFVEATDFLDELIPALTVQR